MFSTTISIRDSPHSPFNQALPLRVALFSRELTQAYNVQYDHFDPRLAA